MATYVIMISTFKNNRWGFEVFRGGYETIGEAAKAMEYLSHHDGELGKKLSIREAV